MVKAITVCVDYHDILAMTLPYNKEFISEMMVVTTPADERTIAIAQEHGAQVHVTDTFYRRGAHFNKFGALEEALDVFGREGWMLIVDADIAIPKLIPKFIPQEGCIYTPHRRIKEDITDGIPEERKWRQYKRPMINEEFAGYFQLFHGSDRMLGPAPWHSTDWTWAGGADSAFHNKWPATKKVRPPFEVLHLGPPFTNWAGRVSKYKDGTVDEKAKAREETRDMLLKSRKQSGPLDRFRKEKLS
jgi:hypothetical protein